MLIGHGFDLYSVGSDYLVICKETGEKFRISVNDFEDYLEDIVEFAAKKV